MKQIQKVEDWERRLAARVRVRRVIGALMFPALAWLVLKASYDGRSCRRSGSRCTRS